MEAVRREDRGDSILAEIGAKGDFPAAMQAIERLRSAIARDDCTSLGLAHVILQDAGLSSKVLRVVNSAFYRSDGVPISTITRAIILLGFDRIAELATGLLLLEQFARNGAKNGVLREHLRRSLRCGIVAEALSRRGRVAVPEEAYLLGLFSNLGVLWLATYYPEDVDEAAARVSAGTSSNLEDALSAVLGTSPAIVAERVLEQWCLPASYASYFRRQAARAPRDATGGDELVLVVGLADAYARSVERDPRPGPPEAAIVSRLADGISLSREHVSSLLQRSEGEFEEQARALGLRPVVRAAPLGAQRRGVDDTTGGHDRAIADAPAGHDAKSAAPGSDPALALAIITEITDSIRGGLELNEMLVAILEGIARSGAFDVVVLSLLDRDRRRLIARLGFGEGVSAQLERLSVPLQPGAGWLAEVVLTHTPKIVAVCEARDLVPPGVRPPLLPTTSLALEPITVRGRPIGVVLAGRSRPPAVSTADAALVRLFANLTCIGLAENGARTAE